MSRSGRIGFLYAVFCRFSNDTAGAAAGYTVYNRRDTQSPE